MRMVLALAFGVVLSAQQKTAADLLRAPINLGVGPDRRSCGIVEDRGKALAELGDAALPDLEKALDSLEAEGQLSPYFGNAGLAIYSYARIAHQSAFPRLRRLFAVRGGLGGYQNAIGDGIAIALGLTSYVEGGVPVGLRYCEPYDPRDALDGFILNWQKQHKDHGELAVGYRFEVEESWAKARFTSGSSVDGKVSGESQVLTTFFNAAGARCGTFRIRFEMGSKLALQQQFMVNDADAKRVTKVLKSCLAR